MPINNNIRSLNTICRLQRRQYNGINIDAERFASLFNCKFTKPVNESE